MKQKYQLKEDGFTLVEMLVVILIIGILAAIAIPVFLNQRKQAAVASVKSDLKNAALSMESEAVGNKGKFLAYVPNYNPRSAGVNVSLNNFVSSEKKFCLVGKSEVYPDVLFSYDSTGGGLLDKGKSCSPPPADDKSFSTVLAGKKALIVFARDSSGNSANAAAAVISYLKTYGIGTAEYIYNPDPSIYKNYDVIIANGAVWTVPIEVYRNLKIGYDNGAHILTDGNDADSSTMPDFIGATQGLPSGGANFNQTGATGLSPSFPYTFAASSFGSDNWICMQTAKPGVVIIADTENTQDRSKRCITASGMSSGNGRWINLNFAPLAGDTSMTGSALNWLTF